MGVEAASREEVEMEKVFKFFSQIPLNFVKVTMKIIDESERLKGEVVGVSLEEEEGIRKRKGVVNNLAEQETSRLLNLSRWIGNDHQSAQAGLMIIAVR